ncbi:hypothetical protein [Acetomicrobium sp. UBA5826]|uniref:hypothetical protein n=1 Tax=Acetomicrobium sp. UBA5826 TaxID=1946039 RepID=UPI002580F228|nr:hypothetical protein [Acetomicrobium sp. UBA5826]
MGDHVHLHEARPGIVPVGERPHRDLLLQKRAGLRDAAGLKPHPLLPARKYPVYGGCGKFLELLADPGGPKPAHYGVPASGSATEAWLQDVSRKGSP